MQQTVSCGSLLGYPSRAIDVTQRLLLSVTIVALAGCSATADRAARLQTNSKGMSVAQVTDAFGKPTVDRTVQRGAPSSDPCSSEPSAVRALEYHVPDKGIVRSVLEAVGVDPLSSMTVLCVDQSAVVRSTAHLDF